jgi:hypothetical protein
MARSSIMGYRPFHQVPRSLERHRSGLFEDYMLDNSPAPVVPYLRSALESAFDWTTFGLMGDVNPKTGKRKVATSVERGMEAALGELRDSLTGPGAGRNHDLAKLYVRAITRIPFNVDPAVPPLTKKLAGWHVAYQVATKLTALPFAIQQVTQLAANGSFFGVHRLPFVPFRLMFNLGGARGLTAAVRQLGPAGPFHEFVAADTRRLFSGPVGAALHALNPMQLVKFVSRANQSAGALLADTWAQAQLDLVRSKGKPGEMAERAFKAMNLDFMGEREFRQWLKDHVFLSDKTIDRLVDIGHLEIPHPDSPAHAPFTIGDAIRLAGADFVEFNTGPNFRLPILVSDNPLLQFFTTFASFQINQAHHAFRERFMGAFRYKRAGQAVSFLAVGSVFGTLYAAISNLLKEREVKSDYMRDPYGRLAYEAWQGIYNAGVLGTFQNLVDVYRMGLGHEISDSIFGVGPRSGMNLYRLAEVYLTRGRFPDVESQVRLLEETLKQEVRSHDHLENVLNRMKEDGIRREEVARARQIVGFYNDMARGQKKVPPVIAHEMNVAKPEILRIYDVLLSSGASRDKMVRLADAINEAVRIKALTMDRLDLGPDERIAQAARDIKRSLVAMSPLGRVPGEAGDLRSPEMAQFFDWVQQNQQERRWYMRGQTLTPDLLKRMHRHYTEALEAAFKSWELPTTYRLGPESADVLGSKKELKEEVTEEAATAAGAGP